MITLYSTWLEIMFGEGAEWTKPTAGGYTQLVIIIVLFIAVTIYVRVYYSRKTKKVHEEQFFFFKAMQKGLTEYQSKLLQRMARITDRKTTDDLLKDEIYFENSIAGFLAYLSSRNESRESLSAILHDIIIIHEKIFHKSSYKKPLENLYDVEINILLCFFTESNDPFIGKLRRISPENMVLRLFRGAGAFPALEGKPVTFFLWRSGDAEYIFTSRVIRIDKNIIEFSVPSEFTRTNEARHPYVNVFVPCEIFFAVHAAVEEDITAEEKTPELDQNELIDKILAEEEAARDPMKRLLSAETKVQKPDLVADIIKINENEAVLRSENKIEHNKDYFLSFNIADYQYRIKATPVSDRLIDREHIYNYTFRFKEISDNALRVLRNFLSENLH